MIDLKEWEVRLLKKYNTVTVLEKRAEKMKEGAEKEKLFEIIKYLKKFSER